MALVLGALMVVFAWLVWTQPEQLKLLPAKTTASRPAVRPSLPILP